MLSLVLPSLDAALAGREACQCKNIEEYLKGAYLSLNELSEVRKQEYLFLSAASLATDCGGNQTLYGNDGLNWGLLDGLEIPCPSVKTHNHLRYCPFTVFAVTSVPEPY